MTATDGSRHNRRPDWHAQFPAIVTARTFVDIQQGWDAIVFNALTELTALLPVGISASDTTARVLRIEQKYGSLRIDTTRVTASIAAVIAAAEAASLRTCEFCGELGRLREHDDWLMTCCDACAATRRGG